MTPQGPDVMIHIPADGQPQTADSGLFCSMAPPQNPACNERGRELNFVFMYWSHLAIQLPRGFILGFTPRFLCMMN